MKNILFSLLILMAANVWAQKGLDNIPYYDNINFENKFVLLLEEDPTNNYYVLNTHILESETERKILEKLIFQNSVMARIDVGHEDIFWVKVDKAVAGSNPSLFTELLAATKSKFESMTEIERNEWLSNNTK